MLRDASQRRARRAGLHGLNGAAMLLSMRARVPGAERGSPGTSRRIYRSRRDMRHWRAREIIFARDAVVGAGKETQMSRYPVLVAAAAALLAMSPALAQQDPAADYPNRPAKIIVSVPAGGGVDTVTTIFAAGLQQPRAQPVGIGNGGGAGGNSGAETVYAAEPDGYTLLASQPAPITSNVALYKKLNFDPAALESVAVMAKFPNVLLVRQDFP